MKRSMLPVMAACLAIMSWTSICFAVSDSEVATATLRVRRRAVAWLMWEEGGQASQDFGAVAPGTTISDNLILEIEHNLGFAQTFSLSVEAAQTAGPGWEGDVRISDGAESMSLSGARSTPPMLFSSPIEAPADHIQQVLPVIIHVAPTQEAGSYHFEFTVNVTSL
jgi:hypothetical protein